MKDIKRHYPNLIIGFGKAGKTLAAYLANHGQEVALIEQSEAMYGGTCINVACIPTKSLITNAERSIPYPKAFEMKDELTSFLRKKNFDNLDGLPKVTVITGRAFFVSSHEVSIDFDNSTDSVKVSAERIVINTGSQPFVPDIPGIKDSKSVFTSASLMEQSAMPEKLVIIGGGFIGLEFADMYAKFGSEVILLDQRNTFLPKEDRDIADEIFKAMTAKKINVTLGVSIEKLRDTKDGLIVHFKDSDGQSFDVEANAVLVATGRRPNTQGLNLEAAGIVTNDRGFIKVDDQLRTSIENIWAVGDVNGGPQFTYTSLDDFRILRDQLFGGAYTSLDKRKVFASSVFITPPLAHIGLREKDAEERGLRIKVARLPAAAIPRARILGNTTGMLKSVVDADTGKILGCTLFCVESSEMINTIQVAINAGLGYTVIRDSIFTHPSMTEAFNDLYSTI